MGKKKEVLEAVDRLLDEGEKPSVEKISAITGYHPHNVHGMLNQLEREGEVRSRSREVSGRKYRLIERLR